MIGIPGSLGPPIDYLVKDYESFRSALLARIASRSTGWTERSPVDLGIALVEVLAYAADLLSYHQDSVATEASLATARQRISVRRHARLLDHVLSEGCNARAWVCFRVDKEVKLAGPGDESISVRQLVTRTGTDGVALPEEDLPRLVSTGSLVFAPMHEATLRPGHHEIHLAGSLLPGATQAILCDPGHELGELAAGDVLIFEDKDGPERRHHPVRLNEILLAPPGFVGVSWHAEDALPFALFPHKAVVRGNVVLVDHGRLVKGEDLGQVQEKGWFQPVLSQVPLTWRSMVVDCDGREVPFDPEAPAASALRCDPARALPDIKIWTLDGNGKKEHLWAPRHDLLDSGPGDLHFVVEVRNDGRAQIRFGNDIRGCRPWPGSRLVADYRLGSGRIGNVGAESIHHVLGGSPVLSVWNPLPATGGSDPASLDEARITAPAELQRQERGVTAEDLEKLAARHPEVAAAHAELKWAGSWYVARVTVERTGGQPAGVAFLKEIRAFLEPYRLLGSEIEVRAGRYVPLDLAIRVWSYPAYPPGTVRAEVQDVLASGTTRSGSPGFFHPSRWPFRRPVRFSELARAVLGVAGVARLEPVRFRRHGALEPLPVPIDGDLVIPLDAFERAQVSTESLEIQVEALP